MFFKSAKRIRFIPVPLLFPFAGSQAKGMQTAENRKRLFEPDSDSRFFAPACRQLFFAFLTGVKDAGKPFVRFTDSQQIRPKIALNSYVFLRKCSFFVFFWLLEWGHVQNHDC